MKKITLFAAAIAVIIFSSVYADAAVDIVTVKTFSGKVDIMQFGGTLSIPCSAGMILMEGTRISTGPDSFVDIGFGSGRKNLVRIQEKSEVILKIRDGKRIDLIDGEVFTLIKKMKKGESFMVKTPGAVCGARGTGWLTLFTDDITEVLVVEDKVFLKGLNPDGTEKDEDFWVEEGYQRRVKKFQSPGESKKISRKKLSMIKKQLSQLSGAKENLADKIEGIEKTNKREETMERRQDSKDKQRLDDRSDKKESGGGYIVSGG